MVRSRPKVTLSAAVSLDGKIASVDGDSKLSSYEDTKRVHKVRAKHDAILIGWRTAVLDDPILTVRYTKGKNPVLCQGLIRFAFLAYLDRYSKSHRFMYFIESSVRDFAVQ